MILVVSSSYPNGPHDYRGAFVRRFAMGLESCGHRVQVLAPHPGASLRAPAAGARGPSEPSVHYIGQGGAGDLPFGCLFGGAGVLNNIQQSPSSVRHLVPAASRFAAAIEQFGREADVLVVHWLLPFGLVAAATKNRHELPLWIVCHSGGVRVLAWLPTPIRRAIGRLLLRSCDCLSFVSPLLREELLRLVGPVGEELRDRCRILPMGIDLAPFEAVSWQPEGPLATVGRLTRLKAIDRLLVSAARQTDCPSVRIAGDGPERRRLEKLAISLGVDAHFLGEVPVNSVPRVLDGASMAVLPSRRLFGGRSEGLPTAALEVLAAGLPFLTTDTWDMPRALRELPGVFCTPDSADGITAGLREALVYLDHADRVDAEARRRAVGGYHWQKMGRAASQCLGDFAPHCA